VVVAGAERRSSALTLLRDHDMNPLDAYASRLAQIEIRHPLAGAGLFDADYVVRDVKSWRGLQQAQAHHDAVYHPDVTGLAKIDQLRHYTLHMAKLAWLLQDAADGGDIGGDVANDRRSRDKIALPHGRLVKHRVKDPVQRNHSGVRSHWTGRPWRLM
jgi:hypothetical protein